MSEMKRGRTEVETCRLNGWGVGTVLRGHESWADGAGTWSTIRITGMGEQTVLGRHIGHERTQDGVASPFVACNHQHESSWTFRHRDWVEVDDPTATPTQDGAQ